MKKANRPVILSIVALAMLASLSLTAVIAYNQAQQDFVNRVCGRAAFLMRVDIGVSNGNRETEIESDEAAAACGHLRSITGKVYE